MNSVTQVTQPGQHENYATSGSSTTKYRKFSEKIWDVLKEKDPPHKIALGAALGIFVGMLPIMGIQMAVVTLVALPFRGNLKAAIAGVWISNPITFIPIYWANYLFGSLFVSAPKVSWEEFGGQITRASNWDWGALKHSLFSLLDMGAEVFVPLWLGSAILALILGVITYFAAFRWVVFYRKKNPLHF